MLCGGYLFLCERAFDKKNVKTMALDMTFDLPKLIYSYLTQIIFSFPFSFKFLNDGMLLQNCV